MFIYIVNKSILHDFGVGVGGVGVMGTFFSNSLTKTKSFFGLNEFSYLYCITIKLQWRSAAIMKCVLYLHAVYLIN